MRKLSGESLIEARTGILLAKIDGSAKHAIFEDMDTHLARGGECWNLRRTERLDWAERRR
jgi:hypothetical protein